MSGWRAEEPRQTTQRPDRCLRDLLIEHKVVAPRRDEGLVFVPVELSIGDAHAKECEFRINRLLFSFTGSTQSSGYPQVLMGLRVACC